MLEWRGFNFYYNFYMEQNNNTPEKNNHQSQKPTISQEEANKKWQEASNKMKDIRDAERLDSLKDELQKIGKLTPNNPKASFLFSDKNGNKDTMKIDMTAQILEFQWKTIKIDLPKWATMSSIVFSQETVKIEGKLWFFSGSWSAGYKELIHAIDNVMQKWNYTLMAGNEQIGFRLA